jgi:hypothetical protein
MIRKARRDWLDVAHPLIPDRDIALGVAKISDVHQKINVRAIIEQRAHAQRGLDGARRSRDGHVAIGHEGDSGIGCQRLGGFE